MDDEHTHVAPHEEEGVNIGGYGAAFRISSPKAVDPAVLREIAEELVREITEACMRRGAKGVGHVKLYLKTAAGYLRADTVGIKYGIRVDGNIAKPEKEADLVVNSIIIGLEKTEVATAAVNAIEEVMTKHGFNLSQVEERRGPEVR